MLLIYFLSFLQFQVKKKSDPICLFSDQSKISVEVIFFRTQEVFVFLERREEDTDQNQKGPKHTIKDQPQDPVINEG